MIEFLVAVLLAVLIFRGGIAKGRYDRRKAVLKTYIKCACGHGSNMHHANGRGSCSWDDNSKNLICRCMRFTPHEIPVIG